MHLNLPSKDTLIVKWVIFAIEMFLIWLVILAQEFAFNRFSGNEVDVLPAARQIVNHSWLPGDWYLNLDIGYRKLFNYLAGILVDQLGFLYGAYAGRILAYSILALALVLTVMALVLVVPALKNRKAPVPEPE